MKIKSIGEAMGLAEQLRNSGTSSIELQSTDLWKDLTRVYTGPELNDAILERCEQLGVNVKALRASIERKRSKRKIRRLAKEATERLTPHAQR